MATLIHKNYIIKATNHKVWEALVNPDQIKQWSGSPAEMIAREGTDFSLWDGEVWGKNLTVDPERSLTQEWWSSDMPTSLKTPSIVSFQLHKVAAGTELKLVHKHVPSKNQASINAGWDDYYLGPLKEFVES